MTDLKTFLAWRRRQRRRGLMLACAHSPYRVPWLCAASAARGWATPLPAIAVIGMRAAVWLGKVGRLAKFMDAGRGAVPKGFVKFD